MVSYTQRRKGIRDLILTHKNSYPYFMNSIKHGYLCFIS